MKKTLVILIAVVLVGMGFACYRCYDLREMNEAANTKLALIEMQLQHKNDVIPHLVNSIKTYTMNEEALLSKIAKARVKLAEAKTVSEINATNKELDTAVNRLLEFAETYPELKANEVYVTISNDLKATNERIAADRMDYNVYVQKLNANIKSLPDSLFAGPLGIDTKEYFKEEAGKQDLPEVNY